jgi:prepilin-type N-terminal cleavage/methylation domain-containing protein/prepilin-type processing-associated H-X9-DG protein
MKRERAFTLIELLVVVAIIALLIAILLPALGKAKDQAKSARCLANLKALGVAVSVYAGVNGDVIPPSAVNYGNAGGNDWMYFPLLVDGGLSNPDLANPTGFSRGTASTFPGLEFRSVFMCPSTPNVLTRTTNTAVNTTSDGYFEDASYNFDKNLTFNTNPGAGNFLIIQASYGFNGSVTTQLSNGAPGASPVTVLPVSPLQMITTNPGQNANYTITRKLSQMPATSLTVYMYDGSAVNPWSLPLYRIFGRHGTKSADLTKSGKVNLAFFDGHAETAARGDLPSNIAEWNDYPNNLRFLHHDKYVWRLDQVQ